MHENALDDGRGPTKSSQRSSRSLAGLVRREEEDGMEGSSAWRERSETRRRKDKFDISAKPGDATDCMQVCIYICTNLLLSACVNVHVRYLYIDLWFT